jgi:hypothetical protein
MRTSKKNSTPPHSGYLLRRFGQKICTSWPLFKMLGRKLNGGVSATATVRTFAKPAHQSLEISGEPSNTTDKWASILQAAANCTRSFLLLSGSQTTSKSARHVVMIC